VDPDSFWAGVDKVVTDLAPRNQELLARRDELQAQIDKWHRARSSARLDAAEYKQFLTDIGYLLPEPADFTVRTAGVDAEITSTAGPQLVVPILNARFALNAANARWGSLYDALYGTDVISEADGAEKGSSYNRVRGDKVIAYARKFLDEAVPLASGSWADITRSRSPTVCSARNWPIRAPSSATPAPSATPPGRCCSSTTACTSRS
jgi:malate synthase